MTEVNLNAEIRVPVKNSSRKLLREGKVPGVYYYHGQPNLNISTKTQNINQLVFTAEFHIVNLILENGENKKCIVKDYYLNPITDKVSHFDLIGIAENEEIELQIPIKLVGGIPKGVKDGGILQHILHKIKIKCLPKYIPEHIEVNISELGINSSVHIKDISIENVSIIDLGSKTIVGVVPPTVIKETTPAEAEAAAAAAPAEPELIAKGKKPEEEEAK